MERVFVKQFVGVSGFQIDFVSSWPEFIKRWPFLTVTSRKSTEFLWMVAFSSFSVMVGWWDGAH